LRRSLVWMTDAVSRVVSVGRLGTRKVELSKQVDSSNDVEVRWTGPGCFRKIGWYVIASVEGALFVESHQCRGMLMWCQSHYGLESVWLRSRGLGCGCRFKSKTKIMSSGINPTNIAPIVLNCMQIEEVHQFLYLGTTFTSNGQSNAEILVRIAQARAAFGHLHHWLWSRSEIRVSTKCHIYQALVRSILLYG